MSETNTQKINNNHNKSNKNSHSSQKNNKQNNPPKVNHKSPFFKEQNYIKHFYS